MKILMADSFDKSLPGRLSKFGEVFTEIDKIGEADVILVRSKTKVTEELVQKAPNLKLVIRGGVGLDNVDKKACEAKNIKVMNTPEASSIAVAELAFGLMLAVPNRIVEAHNSMKEGKWLKKELKRTELFQKTLGLVGIGRIGNEVAKRAKAFEMAVIAFDPFVKEHPVAKMVSLDELLTKSDYISLHTPLTDETRGMFNADKFSKMKDGVVIVNTGRAKVLDEQALIDALKSGKVGCYATDVWPSDPPPDGYPLISVPNVLMAPHIGASSNENLLRIGDKIVEILSKGV
jgi:D-3-phosphoglycerate dehydrogenase